MNDTDAQTNYGLSKMEFANSVISDLAFENIEFENFLLIFDLIQEICKDIIYGKRIMVIVDLRQCSKVVFSSPF